EPARHHGHPQLRILRGAVAGWCAEVRSGPGHRGRRAGPRARAHGARPGCRDRLRPDRPADDHRLDLSPGARPGLSQRGARMRRLVALVLAMLAVPLSARAQEPKSEEDKTLYAIGYSLAERLAPFALSAAELEMVKGGLADGVLSRERKVDPRAYM